MPQKRKQDAIRRNRPKVVDMRAHRALEVPPPQKSWLKATKDWWVAFWESEFVTASHDAVDLPAVRRLASLMDLRERAYRTVQKDPWVTGSMGQVVEHPAAKAMSRYDAEIRQLEDRFGLHPRSRQSMGVQLLQATKTLEDMNQAWQEDHRDDDSDSGGAPVVIEI